VHTGTAESGHYYSFIKERSTTQWFLFNDTQVEPFEERNLAAQAYGGQETSSTWDAALNRYVMRPGLRSYSAYMLFYQRRYRPVAPNASDWLPPLNPVPAAEASKLVPKKVYDDIWNRNAQCAFSSPSLCSL
jgi:ubiquitin carboxyl-terminal hydrolase 34